MPATISKGHWPRGRRRNNCDPELLALTLRTVNRQIRVGVISRIKLAGLLKIHDRTLRRWLAGEDWPTQRDLQRLEAVSDRLRIEGWQE